MLRVMKMIKPIVNISKIVDDYKLILLGYNGVLVDGANIYKDALETLKNLHLTHKKVVLVTNSSQRISAIVEQLQNNGISLNYFSAIVSSGEILHYMLKNKIGQLNNIGSKYYSIGTFGQEGVLFGLGLEQVSDIAKADFLYVGQNFSNDDIIDKYLPDLQYATALSLPMVCAGNDSSCFVDGKIVMSSGALAEQYAILGGQIVTIGKPDVKILEYSIDGFDELAKSEILLIGDNLQTDIKGANLLGVDSVLISKGVHVNYLGEGYIPDVAKTRELATNFDAFPNYVVSNFRW